jgi:hypothetical protein
MLLMHILMTRINRTAILIKSKKIFAVRKHGCSVNFCFLLISVNLFIQQASATYHSQSGPVLSMATGH